MGNLDTARKNLNNTLLNEKGFLGTGISSVDGKPVIKVYMENGYELNYQPNDFEGFMVVYDYQEIFKPF